jgi:DNA mismatch repair protein MutL
MVTEALLHDALGRALDAAAEAAQGAGQVAGKGSRQGPPGGEIGLQPGEPSALQKPDDARGSAVDMPAGTEPTIRVLPPLVASQIAAGEVVERPASIVKELLENAIDAGATRIRVELERGGIELVRVSDDGCGIAPEQLALAVTPSATSKLRSPQDLLHIGTLGFRGEALASIASVSRCTIRSRRAKDTYAHEVQAFGSVSNLGAPKPVAGSVGTTISAANVFFNVPARRAFLRTLNTERDRCLEVVDHAALAHPGVAFEVRSDGQVVRDYPQASGPAQRILAVLGEELASQLFTINASTDDLTPAGAGGKQGLPGQAIVRPQEAAPVATLFGVAGLPAIARGTMKGQYLFVNGRPVKDRAIGHAIAEAYRGLIEPGRYPTVVLLIEIDPALVDVNVHPQKSEVRFRDGGLLHSLVLRALREGLAKADLTPAAADLGADLGADRGAALGSSGLRGLPGGHANRLGQADGRGVFGSPGSGFRHIAWAPPVPEGASGGEPELRQAGLREPGLREPGLLGAAAPLRSGLVPGAAAPHAAHPAGSLSDAKFAEFFATRYQPGESLPASLAEGLAGGSDGGLATAEPSEAQRGWSPAHGGLAPVPILHVHDKYVVTRDEAGLVIIDQHALHERVMFEKLLARIASGPLESQPLLTPIVVPSTRDAVAMLDGLSPLLARLGLSLAALGPQTVGVQSAPTLLIERRVDIGVFARELLDKALRGGAGRRFG